MFGARRNAGDSLDACFQIADRPHHLEVEDGNAVAKVAQWQALENDIAQSAPGRRLAHPLFRLDQRIGQLIFCSAMKPHLDGRKVEFSPVGPHTADKGDRALAEAKGKIAEIGVLLDLHSATTALAAGAFVGHLLLETGRPDQRAADARRALNAADGAAFVGSGYAHGGQTLPPDRPRTAEQGGIDHAAGNRTCGRPDDRADRAEDAAERRACCLQKDDSHVGSLLRKAEDTNDTARPAGCQRRFDYASLLVGVDETAGRGENAGMFCG